MSRRIKALKASEVFCIAHGERPYHKDLEERFFRTVRMPNGTYKTSAAGRLTAFDELIVQNLAAAKSLKVLDVGVSSGITTLELGNKLKSITEELEVVAIDSYLWAQIVRIGSVVEVLYSSKGDILQVSLGPVVRPLPQSTIKWRNYLMSLSMKAVASISKLGRCPPQSVPLVHADVPNCRWITLIEHDVAVFRPDWD
jgi:hypothetical protein